MRRTTAGLLATTAVTAGLLAGTPSPASAGSDYNFCGGRYSSQLNNSAAFTTETRYLEIQSRTAFYRSDGTVKGATPWYNHGFRAENVQLYYKASWSGYHTDVLYSRTFWRAMNSDGTVHRNWMSNWDYC